MKEINSFVVPKIDTNGSNASIRCTPTKKPINHPIQSNPPDISTTIINDPNEILVNNNRMNKISRRTRQTQSMTSLKTIPTPYGLINRPRLYRPMGKSIAGSCQSTALQPSTAFKLPIIRSNISSARLSSKPNRNFSALKRGTFPNKMPPILKSLESFKSTYENHDSTNPMEIMQRTGTFILHPKDCVDEEEEDDEDGDEDGDEAGVLAFPMLCNMSTKQKTMTMSMNNNDTTKIANGYTIPSPFNKSNCNLKVRIPRLEKLSPITSDDHHVEISCAGTTASKYHISKTHSSIRLKISQQYLDENPKIILYKDQSNDTLAISNEKCYSPGSCCDQSTEMEVGDFCSIGKESLNKTSQADNQDGIDKVREGEELLEELVENQNAHADLLEKGIGLFERLEKLLPNERWRRNLQNGSNDTKGTTSSASNSISRIQRIYNIKRICTTKAAGTNKGLIPVKGAITAKGTKVYS